MEGTTVRVSQVSPGRTAGSHQADVSDFGVSSRSFSGRNCPVVSISSRIGDTLPRQALPSITGWFMAFVWPLPGMYPSMSC